ncbi:MAG TPA: hypothetical protein VF194_13440 [Ferrovibrio sp.]|uniref:hypothetical protein n=1 Tax=Ferrovibrio sp. TaxID=1917215 RepID=UPI002ED4E57E
MSEIGSIPPIQPAAPTGQGDPAPTSPQTAPPTEPAANPQAAPQPAPPSAPQPPPAGQTAPQPPAPGADAATRISEALRALASGGQFTAQVVAQDGATLLARTAAGTTLAFNNLATVLAQANVAVLNAALRLQLNPENPQQATVLSANGVALQPPLAALVQPPTAAQLALAAAPPQPAAFVPPVPPQAGQTLQAVVLPSSSAPTAAPVAAPVAAALPPGSRVQIVVQSVSLPAAASPAPSAAAEIASPPPGQAAPGASSPQSSPAQVTAAPAPSGSPAAGSAVAAQVSAPPSAAQSAVQSAVQHSAIEPPAIRQPLIQPSVTAQPATPAAAAAPTASPSGAIPAAPGPPSVPAANPAAAAAIGSPITGIVSGQSSPSGQVLVSTPQGLLSLALPQPLPAGTQISFALAAITPPPTPATTTLAPAPLSGVLARLQGEWPALQQTLDAIRAADPTLAERLQTDLLPQPNARLAAAALNFMAAAAAGNAQAWLGSEAVRKLEQKGRGDLVRKLDDDFKELGRLNQRQSGNDWQALVMPMLIGGKVEPVQIFMRRRRDAKKRQNQTRFIIDFNLESTGPIQFDGFVSSKQLDLILRSESEFGPAFRLDVTDIFTNALEVTGMTGSIRFHDRQAPLAWPSPELDAGGPTREIKA